MRHETWVIGLCLLPLLYNCAQNCDGPDATGAYVCDSDDDSYASGDSRDNDDDDGDGGFILEFFFSSDDEDQCKPLPFNPPCTPGADGWGRLMLSTGAFGEYRLEQLEIHRGKVESSPEVLVLEPADLSAPIRVAPGPISVRALYTSPRGPLAAIDGGNVGKESHHFCEGSCYAGEDLVLDLRIEPPPGW